MKKQDTITGSGELCFHTANNHHHKTLHCFRNTLCHVDFFESDDFLIDLQDAIFDSDDIVQLDATSRLLFFLELLFDEPAQELSGLVIFDFMTLICNVTKAFSNRDLLIGWMYQHIAKVFVVAFDVRHIRRDQ